MHVGEHYNGQGPHLTTHVQASWLHCTCAEQNAVPLAERLVCRETGKEADVRTYASTPWVWPGTSEVPLPSTRHT